MTLQEEIKKRRTFAIISHPDAGKTTITEQLLKFGGAIREAGTVKARKTGNFAKSDWMDIEKERGISVTSSVMQFDYAGKRVNILDTPGHEDFSEDTYRTLMAVDAAVMVIDSAKGIEAQTKKLFQVVKRRGIPVFTFINKLDRDGREPLDLLSELEEILGIASVPMNWPIGMGKNFQGLYDFTHGRVEVYQPEDGKRFVEFDENGLVKSIEEKPEEPKSNYAVTGLYFYDNDVIEIAKNIEPSPRGELEITDVNKAYLERGDLSVELMGRGFAWLDTGTHESLLQASQYIETVQRLQNVQVANLEEIAYRMGYITKEQVYELAQPLKKNEYGQYLLRLIGEA